MMARVALLDSLLDRISSRRRPQLVNGDPQWIVGHPTICPYRFCFRLMGLSLVTLVVYDAKTGNRLLPPMEGKSVAFTYEQARTVLEIFSLSLEGLDMTHGLVA